MKRKYFISFLVIGVLLFTGFTQKVLSPVYVSDQNLLINQNRTPANKSCKNPLLTYNDTTYIAVRDVASFFDLDMTWIEPVDGVSLSLKTYEEPLVQNTKTALALGKALIEDHFADRITDTTLYEVSESWVDHPGVVQHIVTVNAIFSSDDLLDGWSITDLADVRVYIIPETWTISDITEIDLSGKETSIKRQTPVVYPFKTSKFPGLSEE